MVEPVVNIAAFVSEVMLLRATDSFLPFMSNPSPEMLPPLLPPL